MPRRPADRNGFHFAIICALPLEYDAVHDSFDEAWPSEDYGKASGDPNRYVTGRMGELSVVLLLLPGTGKSDAASAAASLRSSYRNLSLALVVGVCGAIPYLADDTEVILGDVIISKYVVRYDFGRQYPDEFKPKRAIEDTLGRPNKETRILSAFLETSSGRDKLEEEAHIFLQQLQEKMKNTKHRGKYDYIGTSHDKLFKSDYRHKHYIMKECDICGACYKDKDPVCESSFELKCPDLGCCDSNLITRTRLQERNHPAQPHIIASPVLAIHTGGVGSADTVMKSGKMRDSISRRDRVIAFEMEGAGVWDELPSCLVIKGVCDYADSHKPKSWQKYAAATAASVAKALLQNHFKEGRSTGEARNSVFAVPFTRNNEFVGRDDEIKRLLELCDTKSDRIALFGMGGAGKTQVALELAYRIYEKEPKLSVLWLPAFSMSAFQQACTDLVKKFDLSSDRDDDPREVLQQYLGSEGTGRWLLILDNADSEEVLRGSAVIPGINVYLPRSLSGQILVTTRWRKIAANIAKKSIVSIKEMGQQDAQSLLRSSLGPGLPPFDDHTLNDLLKALAYLPLAIIQAAAYINMFEVSLKDYLQLWHHSQHDMMELMRNQHEDDTLYEDSQGAVATTWLISFNQIQNQNPSAAKLLFFIMCIEPQAIPQSLLPDVGSEQERTKAIGTLKGYGFLQERSTGELFDMHSLVHIAMQFWAKDQGIDVQKQTGALAHLASLFRSNAWEERLIWRPQLPHVLYIFRSCQDFNLGSLCALGYWAGKCLEVEGRSKEALSVLEHVVKVQKTTLAEDHPSRLASQHELAGAYESNGQIKEAVALLEHVVKVKETTLAEDHPSRLASQHALAGAYKSNGQIKEAVALLEHVVKVEETTLAEDHPSRLASQHALAGAYESNGQIKEAVALLEHVVKVRETTLAEDHPSRLASQHALAGAYESNGQIKEAIALLEHVVKVQETTLAEDHPSRLASQHELASTYRSNGQIKEAVALLEHVVKVQETTLAEDHPSRLASQHTLAGAYESNGQIKEAVALLEHVVKVRETTLAEDHPSRLASQHALAGAYESNGQIKEAIALLEHVVKVQETTLAEDHPSRLASQHALAGAYKSNGQIKEAVALLEHVVKVEETTLAEDHPSRLASQHALAGAYESNGQIKEAVALLEYVVKVRETTLAEDHPSRLASQHTLAGAYESNGQIKEAIALLEHVVKVQETTLAEDHPSRLASQHELASTYRSNGQIKEAVALLEHVVKVRETTLAEDHPSRLASQHALEQCTSVTVVARKC